MPTILDYVDGKAVWSDRPEKHDNPQAWYVWARHFSAAILALIDPHHARLDAFWDLWAEALQAAENSRRTHIDPNRPTVLHREVDYSRGAAAAWWPKGASPVLAELVERGELPPVAERVGGEPCVVEGVEGVGRYGGTWIRIGNGDNDVFGVGAHVRLQEDRDVPCLEDRQREAGAGGVAGLTGERPRDRGAPVEIDADGGRITGDRGVAVERQFDLAI